MPKCDFNKVALQLTKQIFCLHEVDTLRTVVRKKTTHIQEKLTGEYLK